MNLPQKLPVTRIDDEHTKYAGRYKDGQFWGYSTFVFPAPPHELPTNEWQKYRREYVVLHLFDHEGNYNTTKHWFAGTADQIDTEVMGKKLSEWVSELKEVEFTDIEVCLFQTVVDGYVFGLIPNSEDGSIELQPSSTIAFMEPWDGEYYT